MQVVPYFKKIQKIHGSHVLMMSEKRANSCLFKIKVVWNKNFDAILPGHDFISKTCSGDSNYVADVDIWPKFVNSINSVRVVITISIL